MKEEIKVIQLDKYDSGIIINALNEFRNKLIREHKDTEYVNELLLKIINAPTKRNSHKAFEDR